jgi:hypothetical protein
MESSTQTPGPALKVCPRCSVASRTDAERCPNCGRRYQRRWRPVALGGAIVVLAFGAGYGGRSLLSDDDGSNAPDSITPEQAASVPQGISRSALIDRLGGKSPTVVRRIPRDGTCLFYPLTDQTDAVWEFCFQNARLASSHGATGP